MQAVKKIKRTVNMKAAATEDTGGKKKWRTLRLKSQDSKGR